MARKLTERLFYEIRVALENTNDTQASIAKRHNIGSSTVSRVNQCGTWENYLIGVSSIRPIRSVEQRARAAAPTLSDDQVERTLKRMRESRSSSATWRYDPFYNHVKWERDTYRQESKRHMMWARIWFTLVLIVSCVLFWRWLSQ